MLGVGAGGRGHVHHVCQATGGRVQRAKRLRRRALVPQDLLPQLFDRLNLLLGELVLLARLDVDDLQVDERRVAQRDEVLHVVLRARRLRARSRTAVHGVSGDVSQGSWPRMTGAAFAPEQRQPDFCKLSLLIVSR